ncbi:hypothetical protein MHU86_17741 [Fragilaria crotonensis]|nr:hypothetical protein MHU86_17741 [Fragilaria crotonensis]
MCYIYRIALFFLVIAVASSPVLSAASGEVRDLQLSACPNPGSIIPPTQGSTCSVDPTTACVYDKVCCCANCVDRYRCSCKNGAWDCLQAAMSCLPETCPPTRAPVPPTQSKTTSSPTSRSTLRPPKGGMM